MAKTKEAGRSEETIGAEDIGTVDSIGSVSDVDFNSVTEGFIDEQTGYPPYWAPIENGKQDGNGHDLSDSWFKGLLIGKDDREGADFVRYTFIASIPLVCKEGPADEAKEVKVNPGQFFSCSAYAALPLERYIGHEVVVKAERKRPLKGNKDLWVFRLLIGKKDAAALRAAEKRVLEQARAQKNAELIEAEQRFAPPGEKVA